MVHFNIYEHWVLSNWGLLRILQLWVYCAYLLVDIGTFWGKFKFQRNYWFTYQAHLICLICSKPHPNILSTIIVAFTSTSLILFYKKLSFWTEGIQLLLRHLLSMSMSSNIHINSGLFFIDLLLFSEGSYVLLLCLVTFGWITDNAN